MKDTPISFIGLGRMGANMARHLKDLGYSIASVYDINKTATELVAPEVDAVAASSAAEAIQSAKIIFTVIPDDEAMAELFSKENLSEVAGKTFINCATLSPEAHQAAAAAAKEARAEALEAAMASSIPQARNGTLYLMIGGDEDVFQKNKPLLEDLSQDLQYIGPIGSAAKVKALVNMVMNINTAGLAEGLGLGAALGLDLQVLKKVFSQTGANSRVLETDGDDMIARDHDCYFSAAHAAKDSSIANALAKASGVTVPLSEATEAQYRKLIDADKGELDKSAVSELTFPGRDHDPLM
ncbi:NAD(P)-dependent oxidoreductase [Pelagicoccus sp. SDUM812003]|uniref:NAD(P)-dependent oxidoreductase n=1 Tax=Pelagicoccus sp. SDUM812003 TaxID=3041267 RepID=UPI00280CBD01|nr:NAD(P)-dependent oxidoreductase [Pelagicoccus sp. SDUM812003]MDQ8201506.1 NAD(P)-dependent oxidoreductase [Pelagicoccus sp. SDUM812003]